MIYDYKLGEITTAAEIFDKSTELCVCVCIISKSWTEYTLDCLCKVSFG